MLAPFEYDFFVRGAVAATLAGGLCGLIGVYVVLRRMAYVGHGLSHAVFGGAVVSYMLSVNFFLGASAWGFASAMLINLAARKRKIGEDAAIGIVTTASFALGVALISRFPTFTRSFDAALFGNILAVGGGDVLALAAVSAAAAVGVFVGYKHILFTTFDPETAAFYGVPTAWVDALFSLTLAAVIVASLQTLGVTMIAAAIVIPPAAARLLTNDFNRMALLSTGIGAACGLGGVYASWHLDVASGPSVVLTSAGAFLAALAWSALRGRLAAARWRRRGQG